MTNKDYISLKELPRRNPYALDAKMRTGVGIHLDRRKKREKNKEEMSLREEVEEAINSLTYDS